MSKTAAWFWRLPEWAHVFVWVLTHRVPAEYSWCGYVLGYKWQYRQHLHCNAD